MTDQCHKTNAGTMTEPSSAADAASQRGGRTCFFLLRENKIFFLSCFQGTVDSWVVWWNQEVRRMFSHLLFGIENTMLVWNWVSLSDLGKRALLGLCGAVTWSVTVLPYFCHFSDYGCYFCDQVFKAPPTSTAAMLVSWGSEILLLCRSRLI